MVDILAKNPILLLAIVAALGYPLGRIKIAGSSLGVAAVLFVGIAISALNPRIVLPEIIYQFGLILFVYMIGLSNGPAFFASLRRKGLRDNGFVVVVLALVFGLVLLAATVFKLKATLAAGMFAGSLTNTPTLAAILEALKTMVPAKVLAQTLAEPVIGYSITYPMGVVGVLLAIVLMQRHFKVDYAREAKQFHEDDAIGQQLGSATIRITTPEATHHTLQQLTESHHWEVAFGRIKRHDGVDLITATTDVALGDEITVIGESATLDQVVATLGERSHTAIDLDRTEVDYRRILVSNPHLAGHRLGDLHLPQQYGAVVTRIRRGDREFLPHDDTVLQIGDRLRVVAHRTNIEAITAFLGDSYRSLSEIDFLTFCAGLALGLLVGLVPIPLPGGISVKLGIAGGPLVVALILGTIGRSGPFVWNLPYTANLTLRQLGLVMFLAGVGTRAGYAFVSTFLHGGGLLLFVLGAVLTMLVALTTLYVGYRFLKIPMGILTGMLAGLQTQPAVLGFALEQSGNELPNVGYAEVYPIATIAKIVFAQLLLAILLR